MKKKRKYQKAPAKPNKTCYIRIRVTEEQYNTLQERAKKSPYKNLSAWGRKRLLSDKSTSVALTDEEAIKKMNLLLEHLEDNDDVQNVWHNWENPEE